MTKAHPAERPMYSIRVDPARPTMRIDLSGRLTTDEALRALSQAFALAEAGNIAIVFCDLRDLDRGPGNLLPLAAALNASYQAPLRIAFAGGSHQLPLARRFTKFTGLPGSVRCFATETEAIDWLATRRTSERLSSTERRHAEEMLRAHQALSPTVAASRRKRAGPAA